MSQREPPRPQLRLQIGAGHPGANRRQLAAFIKMAQLIQPRQAHGEDGLVARLRVDVVDNAGSAAVGDEPRAGFPGKADEGGHVRVVFGEGHGVRESRNAPAAEGDPVGQALAAGVP